MNDCNSISEFVSYLNGKHESVGIDYAEARKLVEYGFRSGLLRMRTGADDVEEKPEEKPLTLSQMRAREVARRKALRKRNEKANG